MRILKTIDPDNIEKTITTLEEKENQTEVSYEMKILYDTIQKLVNVVKFGNDAYFL